MANPITPHDVHDAYPDNDLLPYRPPGTKEATDHYLCYVNTMHKQQGGDSLFLFLLNELCEEDDMTYQEALKRLLRIHADISAVAHAVILKSVREPQAGQTSADA